MKNKKVFFFNESKPRVDDMKLMRSKIYHAHKVVLFGKYYVVTFSFITWLWNK